MIMAAVPEAGIGITEMKEPDPIPAADQAEPATEPGKMTMVSPMIFPFKMDGMTYFLHQAG
jgi:hypothetical protein